ncbi:MAG: S8 family serine peptidase [Bacteroidia bacterium]|nr:S8 family serine peptidase [Bacteroidia bacterium]
MKSKLIVFLLLISGNLYSISDSSSYFFITFKDKTGTNYTLDKPWEFLSVRSIDRRNKYGIPLDQTDLPINSSYISSISLHKEIKVLNQSKWLNGIEIRVADNRSLDLIRQLPFIEKITFLGRIKHLPKLEKKPINANFKARADSLKQLKAQYSQLDFSDENYKYTFSQNAIIGIPFLHNFGFFRAQKQLIAVFDAGFYEAYKVKGMEDLLDPSTVTLDLVDYDSSVWEDDSHGAKVLSFMKTFHPGYYIGTAPFAEYALFRTEIGNQEYPVEEVNWLFAAEYADSMGVDLISSSVGYHAFDDPSLSYKYSDLNGKNSLISKAARLASEKGMAVICSAGNEGNNSWGKISTPADVAEVMTIGACDLKGFYTNFSSKGPSSDGRIKPDFSVPGYKVNVASPGGYYAGNGTSYSTPMFAGAFACLMGSLPYIKPDSIRKLLMRSASHFRYPDTLYGYGIPDFGLAYCMATGKGVNFGDTAEEIWVKTPSIFHQDLNIYIRSLKNQKVKITIKTDKGSKMKTIASKTYRSTAGQWLHCDLAFQIINHIGSKRKKKREIKRMIIIIETEDGTYQRQFTLG